jgi:hypothetical protein
MRNITPYNTGKVAIGSRYEPAKHHTMSLDELRIQDSLINPPVKFLVMPYDKAIYVLGVVALLVVWLTQ